MTGRFLATIFLAVLGSESAFCAGATVGESLGPVAADCYVPVERGGRIRITGDPKAKRLAAGDAIGVVGDNARLHRRPLFPPADKTLLWSEKERKKIERCGFRPLILAYNEPRFLFDFHSAGGLLGHLFAGLTSADGVGKWFHQWSEIDVRYVEGRMEYTVTDPAFPGMAVSLTAIPLANSAGLLVKVSVEGATEETSLIWSYGGASAFLTNYAMTAPQFTFAPEHCAKDQMSWDGDRFTLRRPFDEHDVYTKEAFAATRYLPDWKAVIHGGSSWQGGVGFGDPNQFVSSPADLGKATRWLSTPAHAESPNCVAVQKVPLGEQAGQGYIVVGMGGNIEEAIRNPEAAWEAALTRNRHIAERIVTHTPDPYLDAAMCMMAFATEGTWGDSAILHGGWSWRFAYLGWRGWYGSTCYGWTDRVKKSIESHVALGLVSEGVDQGGLGSLLEHKPGIYYNMNEVFLDQVRQYFDYTADLELMRKIFPVLEGILEWENKRLQPRSEYLYENSLNTWISDSHWYIQGQCTQSSAYMLAAHRFLADLATRLGKDGSRFERRANRIRAAMQEKLWMPRSGVFAEYLDTRGHGLLHTEPELPTIYHSAEFGAADPLQIYQMLHWVDNHLKSESTPGGGKLYWSSNWFPNSGRSYTHSTYEMAYAEELNLALTNYLAGRADEAYAILRAALCGIFNGPTPGGLSCHSHTDGRQRANDEFADAISMWGRTITEGLFGISPKRADGVVKLSPQFPPDWPEASITTPLLSYHWKREPSAISIEWKSPVKTAVHLRLPLPAASIEKVSVDEKPVEYNVEAGVGLSWVIVRTPPATESVISISYTPAKVRTPEVVTVQQGDLWKSSLTDTQVTNWMDPQTVLDHAKLEDGTLQGIVKCTPGPALLFLSTSEESCPSLIPVRLHVKPAKPAPPKKIWSPLEASDHDLGRWALVDLSKTFNTPLTEVLDRVLKAAKPPPLPASQVGFGYWKNHLGQYHGQATQKPSDAAWRSKVGPDQTAWTTDGIPFRTAKEGSNIAVVTLAGGFPSKLEFPVNARGQTLYLMISGMTFPVQSHVVNLRVTLRYADGSVKSIDLVNPFDIGDCWGTWCGRFHDTPANGFENIGGRFGPAGSSSVQDMTQPITVDTEAHLIAVNLKHAVDLETIQLEAIANDAVFGLMGATILK